MGRNIAVMGAGSMGMAVSILLHGNGHKVKIWSPFQEEVDLLNQTREHLQRLPGVKLPEGIHCTMDMEEALSGSHFVVMAVPSQTMRKSAREMSQYIRKNTIVVSCSKGLEDETCLVLTDVIKQEIPQSRIAVISGPSYAIEIAKGMPTTVVAAAETRETAEQVQDIFMSPYFRVYTNTDVIGVELGGALKNVIALCAGIVDGLGFGDNTKAGLLTRGVAEISRLGVAMGARPQTFAGLTGMGDLILTCTGEHSRNRKAGILIGQGKSVKEALEEVKMVVEGVVTTKPAYEMSLQKKISMPITTELYNVLFKDKSPKQALSDLMMRDKRHEVEDAGEGWF